MLVSCQPHDPFCFHHPHGVVLLKYDWSQAPDAIDIPGTRVRFYNFENGKHEYVANFTGMNGGIVHLGEGTYNVISYNDYTDKIQWRGEKDLTTLEAFTRDANLTEDLPEYNYEKIDGLVLTPNRLWSGYSHRISVGSNDTTIITLTPLKATYEVIWDITGIKGANRVTACAVSISNIGGSLLLDGWKPQHKNSVMSGTGRLITPYHYNQSDNDIGGFQGKMEIFGCEFDDNCQHIFSIYCWSKGGNIKSAYDVTDQLHIVKEDRKIYLHIDADFEIPINGSSDSGFIPDLDKWQEDNEDIIL